MFMARPKPFRGGRPAETQKPPGRTGALLSLAALARVPPEHRSVRTSPTLAETYRISVTVSRRYSYDDDYFPQAAG